MWLIDRRAGENFVRARIAADREPASATGAVVPKFVMRTAGIVAQIDVVGPFTLGRVGRRPRQARIAAVSEFELVARSAPGAGNQHHNLSSRARTRDLLRFVILSESEGTDAVCHPERERGNCFIDTRTKQIPRPMTHWPRNDIEVPQCAHG